MGSTISGIAFLGAGALIKGSDGGVQGFTTGALLVISAFVGINIGSGMYVMGLLLWVSMWCILGIDRFLQTKGFGVHGFRCVLAFESGEAKISAVEWAHVGESSDNFSVDDDMTARSESADLLETELQQLRAPKPPVPLKGNNAKKGKRIAGHSGSGASGSSASSSVGVGAGLKKPFEAMFSGARNRDVPVPRLRSSIIVISLLFYCEY